MNCTSLGLKPTDAAPGPRRRAASGPLALRHHLRGGTLDADAGDAIAARIPASAVSNGLSMLCAQGAEALRFWLGGKTYDVDFEAVMWAALRETPGRSSVAIDFNPMTFFDDIRTVNANFPWFFAGLFTVLGAMTGSFLNVCVYRIPKGLSVVHPGSRCACGAPIPAWRNLPILAWLIWGEEDAVLQPRVTARATRSSRRSSPASSLPAGLFCHGRSRRSACCFAAGSSRWRSSTSTRCSCRTR